MLPPPFGPSNWKIGNQTNTVKEGRRWEEGREGK